jgi:hypothetical protein
MVYSRQKRKCVTAMASSLERAIQRFDSLSEKELSEIARKLIRGSAQLESKPKRKAKTRSMQKA